MKPVKQSISRVFLLGCLKAPLNESVSILQINWVYPHLSYYSKKVHAHCVPKIKDLNLH